METSVPTARFLGVDLDNTLVCYDDLFHAAAIEEGLIPISTPASKELVRDAIRLRPGGEEQWTRLQAVVYGLRMREARLFDGADACLRAVVKAGIPVRIISHKTATAVLDGAEIDIREPALRWMEERGFFSGGGLGLLQSDVFFESTRADKIARIARHGCSHFIDDLVEVFAEPSFPVAVGKLLFAPHGRAAVPESIRAFRSWAELEGFLLP